MSLYGWLVQMADGGDTGPVGPVGRPARGGKSPRLRPSTFAPARPTYNCVMFRMGLTERG